MSKAHFFIVSEDACKSIQTLYIFDTDGLYVVLAENNGYSDIATYSTKYKKVRIQTVLTNHLDVTKKVM